MFAPFIKKYGSSSLRTAPFIGPTSSYFFGKGKDRVDLSKLPKPGEERPITHLKARLMCKPEFLSASVLDMHRGARVKVLNKIKGSWYYVLYRGRKGWVHRNRIMRKKIRISSGNTGTGTSRGEAEFGGRG